MREVSAPRPRLTHGARQVARTGGSPLGGETGRQRRSLRVDLPYELGILLLDLLAKFGQQQLRHWGEGARARSGHT